MTDDSPILQETVRGAASAHEAKGLHLLGVQRAKTWRGRRVSQDADRGIVHVRYRDLEALARTTAFELPDLDPDSVQAHQRAIEAAMRRGTIVPAPYGVVFHGRRPLIKMLQDQYLALDEALSFLDGQCEVRVHIASSDGNDPDEELQHIATQIYSELRRTARAAVPFPNDGRRVLGAAFLVDKTAWVEFISRAEDLVSTHNEVSLDVTGPWPPYDFVRFAV